MFPSILTFSCDLIYGDFIRTFDRLLAHESEENKLSQIKKQIIGPDKQEILNYLNNSRTYAEAKEKLRIKFGTYSATITTEIAYLYPRNV